MTRIMNAIILCGGLATRLGEIAKSVPKILLEIKGKTVLDWQLEKLRAVGITDVVMAAGHLSETLYREAGLRRAGMNLIYAIETERLGTGGAIKHAWEYVSEPRQPVVILNGDVLTTVVIESMLKYLPAESEGIILGSEVEDAAAYGTLVYNDKYYLSAFREKEGRHGAGYINGGIYIFNPSARNYFPEQKSFSIEYDVFPKMTGLYVYQSDRPWVDIGLPERLEWARKNWDENIKLPISSVK